MVARHGPCRTSHCRHTASQLQIQNARQYAPSHVLHGTTHPKIQRKLPKTRHHFCLVSSRSQVSGRVRLRTDTQSLDVGTSLAHEICRHLLVLFLHTLETSGGFDFPFGQSLFESTVEECTRYVDMQAGTHWRTSDGSVFASLLYKDCGCMSLNYWIACSLTFTGSHQECLYQLMSLGIPHDCFPVDSEGESLLQNHWNWIRLQQQLEEQEEEEKEEPHHVENDAMDMME